MAGAVVFSLYLSAFLFHSRFVHTRPSSAGLLSNLGLGGVGETVGGVVTGLGAPSVVSNVVDLVKVFTDVCNKIDGGCKTQKEHAIKTLEAVKTTLALPLMGGKVQGKSKEEIDNYVDKIFQAKLALFKENKLDSLVVPNNDGLFGGDMWPPVEFLQRIIDRADGSGRRKRADAVSLDYYTGNKWPSSTVNFYMDPNTFSTDEADQIRAAVKQIQQQSSCLTLQESYQTPYIEFHKTPYGTSASTCGWANLGYNGDVNPVYINFDSALCKSTLLGVIAHEMLHCLGLSHEHSRYDRDSWINMLWDNVDPQSYDVWPHDSCTDYNPYCVPYDYLSCMHYSPYVAVLDQAKPAFTPVTNSEYYLPLIGMVNGPSGQDMALLNRIYCAPSTCKDASPYCGWTACGQCSTYNASCPKSCDMCGQTSR